MRAASPPCSGTSGRWARAHGRPTIGLSLPRILSSHSTKTVVSPPLSAALTSPSLQDADQEHTAELAQVVLGQFKAQAEGSIWP